MAEGGCNRVSIMYLYSHSANCLDHLISSSRPNPTAPYFLQIYTSWVSKRVHSLLCLNSGQSICLSLYCFRRQRSEFCAPSFATIIVTPLTLVIGLGGAFRARNSGGFPSHTSGEAVNDKADICSTRYAWCVELPLYFLFH